MLKLSSIELELFSDYDKLIFIGRGIRSEISLCVKPYVKANNLYLENHNNVNAPTSVIQCLKMALNEKNLITFVLCW